MQVAVAFLRELLASSLAYLYVPVSTFFVCVFGSASKTSISLSGTSEIWFLLMPHGICVYISC